MVLFFTVCWFYMYEEWYKSVLTIAVVLVVVYPLLKLLAKIPGVSELASARKSGEFANSFVALMIMFIVVASVCWGWLGERSLGIASIFAWGPGDAAAALIGRKIGKHKIGRKKIKSMEGTIAMFAFSFISVMVVLIIFNKFSIPAIIIVSIITAAISAFVELMVENGFDTFYCPVSAMAVLVLAELLLG